MKKQEALKQIKTLRDAINNGALGPWVNAVVAHLDAASDVIEQPPATMPVTDTKSARNAIQSTKKS